MPPSYAQDARLTSERSPILGLTTTHLENQRQDRFCVGTRVGDRFLTVAAILRKLDLRAQWQAAAEAGRLGFAGPR